MSYFDKYGHRVPSWQPFHILCPYLFKYYIAAGIAIIAMSGLGYLCIQIIMSAATNVKNAVSNSGISPAPLSKSRPSSIDIGHKKIAFTSDHDGNQEIYSMDIDGSNLINLTNNPASDSLISWSPDGKKIAFRSDRDGEGDIFVMNADGTASVNLTRTMPFSGDFAWSPNGKKIVLGSNRTNFNCCENLYIMNPDGSNLFNLTSYSSSLSYRDPAWSPHGTKIVFTLWDGENEKIHVIRSDVTDPSNLYNSNYYRGSEPAWSPDGTKIAFRGLPSGNIRIVNADGSNLVDISCPLNSTECTGSWDAYWPSWSPDGKKIAFSNNPDKDKKGGIFVVNSDGSNIVRLTTSDYLHLHQVWSPDGKKIAFTAFIMSGDNSDEECDIFVMNADGSSQTNITINLNGNQQFPSWQP